jgi:hypothetical protein
LTGGIPPVETPGSKFHRVFCPAPYTVWLQLIHKGAPEPASGCVLRQAAEKALKPLLALHDRPCLLTHNLSVPADSCADLDESLHDESVSAVWLTPYAVRFRRPGGPEEPSQEDARRATAAGKRVDDMIVREVAGDAHV